MWGFRSLLEGTPPNESGVNTTALASRSAHLCPLLSDSGPRSRMHDLFGRGKQSGHCLLRPNHENTRLFFRWYLSQTLPALLQNVPVLSPGLTGLAVRRIRCGPSALLRCRWLQFKHVRGPNGEVAKWHLGKQRPKLVQP